MQVTIHIEDGMFTSVKDLLHVIATIVRLQDEVDCKELKDQLEETRLHYEATWNDLAIEMCCDFQSQIETHIYNHYSL